MLPVTVPWIPLACARGSSKGLVTILTLSKGSCRDSKETTIPMDKAAVLALGRPGPSRLRSCECNSYRYRIVKERQPWHAAPEGSPPLDTASSRTSCRFVGRVRRPADQESPLASTCMAESNDPHPAWVAFLFRKRFGYPRPTFSKRQRSFAVFSSTRLCHGFFGGDDRDRTGNLRLAKPALSQLSYVPVSHLRVGVLGFEPRTSALSELRSSQLSYTPSSLTLSPGRPNAAPQFDFTK